MAMTGSCELIFNNDGSYSTRYLCEGFTGNETEAENSAMCDQFKAIIDELLPFPSKPEEEE